MVTIIWEGSTSMIMTTAITLMSMVAVAMAMGMDMDTIMATTMEMRVPRER